MAETTPKDAIQIVTELREDFEKARKNALTSEEKQRMTTALDTFEDAKQAILVERKSRENLEATIVEVKAELDKRKAEGATVVEMKTRVAELEGLVAQRAAKGNGDKREWKEAPEYKALHVWAKNPGDVTPEQKALLRTDSDIAGGFLVPTELDSELRKKIVELDLLRSICRVRSMAVKTMEIAIRNTIPVAYYEGEAESGQKGASAYQSVSVTAHRQAITIPVTMDQLMNSAFDMESEIMGDAALAFAYGEGNNFVAGDGVKKPEGFMQHAAITAARQTGARATFASDIIKLTGTLKVGYDPMYTMQRTTLAHLRLQRDTNGQFLWDPGMNGPVANSIAGYPYLLLPSMNPIGTSGACDPIAFGDFRRGYEVYDRTGTGVIRDDVTRKEEAIVEFAFRRWNTGKVILSEAITYHHLTD